MAELSFWLLTGLVAYAYVGYPALLYLLTRGRNGETPGTAHHPPVTALIAARDEEARIERRIRNLPEQQYPADRLCVVVVSDGSSDTTAERARQVDPERVRVIELPENRGKAAALNAGMREVDTQFVVFADARQRFTPDTVANLMSELSDPRVGAVSGQLLLGGADQPGEVEGAGLYWKYETAIRTMESKLGATVGVTGAIYALRTALWQPLPENLVLDDVLVPMRAARAGYRIRLRRDAQAFDTLSQSMGEEFRRKVRTLAGNFQLMTVAPWINHPRRNPLFWQWISHKVLRLIVPYALIGMLISSALADGIFYDLALGLQLVGYLAALAGLVGATLGRRSRLLNAAASFVMLNSAAVMGLTVFTLGRAGRVWQRH